MAAGVSLLALDPRWLHPDEPLRFGWGISFACPAHLGECRLSILFANPLDMGRPASGVPLHFRRGATLDHITVGRSYEQLDVPGHWRGWIEDGFVFPARDPDDGEDDIETDPGIPIPGKGA